MFQLAYLLMCFWFLVVSIFELFQEPKVHRGGGNYTRPQKQTADGAEKSPENV